MIIFERIKSGKTQVPPVPSRPESHKVKNRDKVKSSTKTVKFVGDFPSTISLMKPNVSSSTSIWTPQNWCFHCSQTSFSKFTTEQKHKKNIEDPHEVVHTLKETMQMGRCNIF